MSMSSESDEQLRARARCEQLRADVEENLRQLRERELRERAAVDEQST